MTDREISATQGGDGGQDAPGKSGVVDTGGSGLHHSDALRGAVDPAPTPQDVDEANQLQPAGPASSDSGTGADPLGDETTAE